jgi:hypothetical protein
LSTVTKYKINGIETQPFRDAINVNVNANFDLEIQPSISIDSVNFVDTNGAKNSQTVRDLWAVNPIEGAPFSMNISNDTLNYDFDFYLDYTRMKFLSDVETEVGLLKNESLDSFRFRSQGITQRLLEFKNVINQLDFQACPYIVQNRKTLLERIQILAQGFIIVKTLIDEIFKLINISADLTTLGGAQAFLNLTTTLGSITVLFLELKNLLVQIQESFFPAIRYHSGIKPKTFIDKAVVNYMGYDSVDYGTLTPIMEKFTTLGRKNNQIGATNPFIPLHSGILNPADKGYNLADEIELIKQQFKCRDAIIDNVYHLRPDNDPFWVNNASYTMPNVLVESVFTGNGSFRPNYEDAVSSTILQYMTDDSDKWTLDDLIDEQDPNSTGKIITVVTVDPINVIDQRKVLLKGSKNIDIPYTLAVRNDAIDNLLDLFIGTSDAFNGMKTVITNKIDSLTDILSAGVPPMEEFLSTIGGRTGVMKVENHFFSVPKMMLLENDSQGRPVIPIDFADKIGTRALYDNYHTWDSFIPLQRNPNDANQTAAKYIYEDVRIPFGIVDFDTITQNSYFSTENGEIGKFTNIEWNIRGDYATVGYWIYKNWMTNIQENIS